MRGAYFREQLPNGIEDNLFLTTIDVHYRIAQHPLMNWYLGFGANILSDNERASKTSAGMNIRYGFDIFPIKPLIVSAYCDLGSLGPEMIWHTRATVGANFRNVEIFTGYDWLKIGAASIHGPLVGVRLWF